MFSPNSSHFLLFQAKLAALIFPRISFPFNKIAFPTWNSNYQGLVIASMAEKSLNISLYLFLHLLIAYSRSLSPDPIKTKPFLIPVILFFSKSLIPILKSLNVVLELSIHPVIAGISFSKNPSATPPNMRAIVSVSLIIRYLL